MEKKDDIFAIARASCGAGSSSHAAELDLFALIEDGDCTAATIANRLGLDRRALYPRP